MREIIVSAVQMDVRLGDLKRNVEKATRMIEKAGSRGSNLIVLPELWPLGFDYEAMANMPPSYIDDILSLLGDMAYKYRAYIVGGSVGEVGDGKFFNTCYLIDPAGNVEGKYRKVHLFKEMGETEFFEPGNTHGFISTHLAKLGIAICYDIRFPELFRRIALAGAEIICVPAQFPYPRQEHWEVLLRARAIENQVFVVGCNRVGKMKNTEFFGRSMIIGPYGETIEQADEGECVITEIIDVDRLYDLRKVLPSIERRRPEAYSSMSSPEEKAEPARERKIPPFKFKNTIQPMKPRH